jgi:hypothetical protein
MRKEFNHINEARGFIVEKLSSDTLLGRNSFKMYESKYVIDYKPQQALDAELLAQAIATGELATGGVRVATVNLYDLVLEHLDAEGLWKVIEERESELDPAAIIETLQASASVEQVIIPRVREELEKAGAHDLVFITGVGETFPYIRTHWVLDALTTEKPVVLWFPGTYKKNPDGSSSLDILDIHQGTGGGYYRATNLFDL